MIALSSKQRAALEHFAAARASYTTIFAGGTLASLRKVGLLRIVPARVPREYETTEAGRGALARDTAWCATLAREASS